MSNVKILWFDYCQMKSHELYSAVTMYWNDFMDLHVHVCFQRVTYETKRPTHDLRMIADVEGGVVKSSKEVEWKEQIIIPALPQSSLAGCDLIKIEYYVKVRSSHCQQCFLFVMLVIFRQTEYTSCVNMNMCLNKSMSIFSHTSECTGYSSTGLNLEKKIVSSY